MPEMVTVDLDGSYGYGMPGGGRKYFGPGKQIPVPYGLALTLGLVKAEAEVVTTPLPKDFPGRTALIAAKYDSLESLAGLTFDQLVAIKGIGDRSAEAILTALEGVK